MMNKRIIFFNNFCRKNDKFAFKMDLKRSMVVASAAGDRRSNIEEQIEKVRHVEIVFSNVLNNFQRLMTAIQDFVEAGDHHFEIDGFTELYEEQQLHIYATNDVLRSNNLKNEEPNSSASISDVESENDDDNEHSSETNQEILISIESPNELKNIAKLMVAFESDEKKCTDDIGITTTSQCTSPESPNNDDGIATTSQHTSPQSPINRKFEPKVLPQPTPFFIDLVDYQIGNPNTPKLETSPDDKKHLVTKQLSINMTMNNSLYEYVPKVKLSDSVIAIKKQKFANNEPMEFTGRSLRPRTNSVSTVFQSEPMKDAVKIESQHEEVNNNSSVTFKKEKVPLDPRATWSYRNQQQNKQR